MCSVKPESARPGFWMRELTTRRSRPFSPASSSSRRSKSLSFTSCSILIESKPRKPNIPCCVSLLNPTPNCVIDARGRVAPRAAGVPHHLARAVHVGLRRLPRALRGHQRHHLPHARHAGGRGDGGGRLQRADGG